MQHTWFWMRSLTRSMGAAAVLETAAATPPTVDKASATWSRGKTTTTWLSALADDDECIRRNASEMKRTQEIDHEALEERKLAMLFRFLHMFF